MEIKFVVIEEWGAERIGSNKREHTAQLLGARAGLRYGYKEVIARVQRSP
jgi:hypothetical protein